MTLAEGSGIGWQEYPPMEEYSWELLRMPGPHAPADTATFQLLGEVRVKGPWQGSLTAGSRKVLALLLMTEAASGMHVGSIANHLWGSAQPASCHQMVRGYIMSLRMALPSEKARITHSRAGGYRMHYDPRDVDAHLFEHRMREGQESMWSGRYLEAIDQFNRALRLWRSSIAMADVQDVIFLQSQTVRLNELRLQAEEFLANARLQSHQGDAQLLIPGLMHLTYLHPFRERLLAQLMIALYASDRKVEALDVYTRTRSRFIESIGIEPSEYLQRIHLAILNGEEYHRIIAAVTPGRRCA
ncbi:AfsR/SARP family transcriptional regulator [Streptomyces chartreusis]